MSAHSALLRRVLRLQIRNWDLSSHYPVGACAGKGTGRGRELPRFSKVRRVQVSAGNVERSGSRHEHGCADREHASVIRTTIEGTRRAPALGTARWAPL